MCSFIRDDTDLLSHLPEKVNDTGITLITFDVINIYTNTPNGLEIKAMKFWLDSDNVSRAMINRLWVRLTITEGVADC